MKASGVCLLLILATEAVLGEVPESILGTWHFDAVRTISEHIDRVARSRPDVITTETAARQTAELTQLVDQPGPQATITFTEHKIISNAGDDRTLVPYRVIGGNSRLGIVESTDKEGYTSVVNIRLIEGGIAIETTNCQEQPEQCQRERRRAMEQLKERQQGEVATTSSSKPFTAIGSDQRQVVGPGSSLPRDDLSQPKWMYFKQALDE